MKNENKQRHFLRIWWGIALLCLVLASGMVFTWFVTRYGESLEKIRLQSLADTAAASFDSAMVAKLQGLPSDAGTSSFHQIREQLKRIKAANPDARFVYLMGLKSGKVVFLADAEELGSKDYSAPGDIYNEVTPWLLRALKKGVHFVEGPLKDAWGEWVTGCGTIINPHTGQVVAVLGIDLNARQWQASVARYRWFGLTFSALVLSIVAMLLWGVYLQRRAGIQISKYNEELKEELSRRKLVEDVLREKETKISSIFLAAPVGIGVVVDRVIQEVNDMLCRMTGYSREELLGKSARLLYPTEQDYDYVGEEKYRQIKEKQIGTVETRWQKKDGTVIDVILSSTPMDPGDLAKGVTFTALDITLRKQAEENRQLLEQRLQRARKMEALGLMAGGVAHDLNNVLGVMSGFSELLLCEIQESSPLRTYASHIKGATDRAAAIIQDMLTLARRGVQTREPVNLNDIINRLSRTPEFEKLLAFHPDVKVAINLEQNPRLIMGVPVQLEKALMNLVSNAAEAMPKGGDIRIVTTSQYLEKPIQGYDEVSVGDYIVLTVSDSGEGISENDIKQIFEPFYTKKVMGRSGTGLGLAVVWGTVKDHQGYIDVKSEAGRGSTFSLYFPVTQIKVEEQVISSPAQDYRGNGESILVVDDVETQRNLADEMLRKLGYNVLTVASGEDAVAYLQTHRVDLVVLDMIMDPGMDGLDTYRNILAIYPGQKAVMVSGFAETERVSQAQALGAGAYVKKPYDLAKLGLAVRKELDRTM